MPTRVVVLGAGFAGLELATRLSEAVPEQVHVTLIDQAESFVFGFTKLDVMFGHADIASVECHYSDIVKPSVDFRRQRVTSIEPDRRRVVTDGNTYDADILVVALGADLDPAATPGFVEGGHEFYSPQGAAHLATVLPQFTSGVALIGVLGPVFKCPPAPSESAFMLHDHLVRHGVRDDVTIHVISPLPKPIPVSVETSDAILAMLAERGITYSGGSMVTRLEPDAKCAHLADGRSLPYDIFLGIPVHRAPAVVVEAGLTEEGWIPVDPATFATRFPDVYAVGDITNAPVPRAGVIAEGEARTVADVIISRVTRGAPPPPYEGAAICYIEMGDEMVARVDVNFLAGSAPTASFRAASSAIAAEKRTFGQSRRQRWFS